MFKKIEIWILYLVILLSILFAIGFGVLVRQELVGGIKAGWISKTALAIAEMPVNLKNLLTPAMIVADKSLLLDGFSGIPNSNESYILLSRYDGDLNEGVVELVDLTNFNVLHTWNPDIDKFNDLVEKTEEFKYLNRDANNARHMLHYPVLARKGELIFHAQVTPLRKIDACSRLVWQNEHDVFHHSIEEDIEGNIWSSTYMYPQSLPIERVGRQPVSEGGYLDDAIVKLSPDGEILYEKSVSQIFIENGLEYLLFAHGNDYEYDPIHINDIQPVNFDGKYWKKGDLFLSIRNQSMVLLYRPSSNQIIWKGNGPFLHQHDVDILDEKKISIFNNRSINIFGDTNIVDGNNEVIIYNFDSNLYSSYLSSSLIEADVRSTTGGRSQILSNGDLFIEESNYGRTLYFNADGSLRWSHINRAADGNVYRVAWSRILYTKKDIQTVKRFLETRGTCNE